MQFDHHPRDLSGRGRGVPIKVFDQCVGDFILGLFFAIHRPHTLLKRPKTGTNVPQPGFGDAGTNSRRRASVESNWSQKRDTLLLAL